MKLIVAAVLIVSAIQCPMAAATDIRPSPGGKRLLFIDGDDIRREPGGKRLLFIDGDTLRDEPGGKALLYIDGDDIRNEFGGIRLAFLDGKEIRRTPNGKVLLFVDDDDIRPDAHGKRLFFIDGKVSKQQLVAALYVLKPDLFKLSKKEEAELKAAMKAAEEESDKQFSNVLLGKFQVLNSSFSDWSGGLITTTKGKDGIHFLDMKLKKESLAGIGIPGRGEGYPELWVAFAPEGAVALAVFDIDQGDLSGKWIPINAAKDGKTVFGHEKWQGPESLDGEFKILDAKAPNNGAAYTGTVTLAPHKPADGNSSDLFDLFTVTWNFGPTQIPGMAAKIKYGDGKSALLVASGTKAEFAVGHVTCQSATLAKGIDFLSKTHGAGYIVWTKQDE
ncbi:hypothetical protein [Schlesneria paludicola]|uniref:hypothetical protein n=1 Tax=Schlesneria paludicola TaxID=360056 RepID=UPI00029AFF7A|nr:hypothetical protein [Schlesneria paludicola]